MINESVNPIDLLDRMLDGGDDIWETAVSIGIQNEHELTKQRWLQGDLTLRVEGAYGDKIITKFATALNVNTSTLKQRRTMSNFYELDTRYIFEDTVGYSHYREAMRMGNIDDAIDVLRYASENDSPVWLLKEYIDKRLGKEKSTHESAEGEITGVYIWDGESVTVDMIVKDAEWIKPGAKVTIKIKD